MPQLSLTYAPVATARISPTSVCAVVAAHVIVLVLLVSLEIIPIPQEMAPLVVQILPPQPSTLESPQPEAMPTTPQKQPVRPLAKPQTLVSTTTALMANSAPEMRETSPAPPAPPAEVAVSQPRFDANYLDNPAPAYPALSKRMGEEGKVLLRVYVEPAGTPSRIEVKNSSGSQRLDQAAEQAVWRWKFIPAKRGGESVAAWVVIPISFNLRG